MPNHGVRVNCLCPDFVLTNLLTDWLQMVWEGNVKVPEEYRGKIPKTYEEARERYMK